MRAQTRLLEELPQLVWMTDPDGRYEYCNRRWYEFTGLSPQLNLTHAWLQLIHPEDNERAQSEWTHAMTTGESYQVEYRVRQRNADYRWLLSELRPLIDSVGNVVRWLGSSTDIDDLKTAEAALRRTEKLAAAGRLAATVAHEINNPLEAVTNLLYLASHTTGVPETACAYMEQANDELRRVAHIVSQTLGFYRNSNAPRLTDISKLVTDVLYLYQRKLETRQIRLCRFIDEGVQATVIAGEIRQVIANLVSNAADAIGSSGVMCVEVHARKGKVEVSISDTGPGIAAGDLGSIFEPFYTTKKDIGTGLGLWVSRGILEKHQGALTVKSSQGHADHGTVFSLVLPAPKGQKK